MEGVYKWSFSLLRGHQLLSMHCPESEYNVCCLFIYCRKSAPMEGVYK